MATRRLAVSAALAPALLHWRRLPHGVRTAAQARERAVQPNTSTPARAECAFCGDSLSREAALRAGASRNGGANSGLGRNCRVESRMG